MSNFSDSFNRARTGSAPKDTYEAVGGCLGVLLAILFIGLVVMLVWNIGVVGIVAASGGHVAKIGYFTALFAWLAVKIVFGAARKISS